MDWMHIYPVNDVRDHETEGKPCWCAPTVDEEEGVIIHNAMDGREAYETGERKPN